MKLISYPIVAAWHSRSIHLLRLLNRLLNRCLTALLLLLFFSLPLPTTAQIVTSLPVMLQKKQLITIPANDIQVLKDKTHPGVTTKGIVWLKGVNFEQGTIDVDLRGKDVFLQSFLGIAFHGVDTLTYDVVYFRPFNFQHPDTLRRNWSVQYMSMPDHGWPQLRKESPLTYEHSVQPVPRADDWFHCRLQITKTTVRVFVNYAANPSLTVDLLNQRSEGLIGLWADGLSGDFSNLTIHPYSAPKR
ncbi:hypothetical protein [Spirosoma linguale]|uniref:3-keto-disaccharide hydrolase domain-containing protein n=1 Tax=Spirosoma linguale (strain ATCC 33905 / DSM 74 / LMG 10896 / Claus 1) TaxID=504472 RepID=D2QR91_SPILD|nr:hypothetical protein Slin_3638 [Spirosoma linguale DSM 74]